MNGDQKTLTNEHFPVGLTSAEFQLSSVEEWTLNFKMDGWVDILYMSSLLPA